MSERYASGAAPRDPRSRAVLGLTKEPGTNVYILELECGHAEFRKYFIAPPTRLICSHCPPAGGFGGGEFYKAKS